MREIIGNSQLGCLCPCQCHHKLDSAVAAWLHDSSFLPESSAATVRKGEQEFKKQFHHCWCICNTKTTGVSVILFQRLQVQNNIRDCLSWTCGFYAKPTKKKYGGIFKYLLMTANNYRMSIFWATLILWALSSLQIQKPLTTTQLLRNSHPYNSDKFLLTYWLTHSTESTVNENSRLFL